jgi:serine protease DegS
MAPKTQTANLLATARFIAGSVVAGLALAFVAVVIRPDLLVPTHKMSHGAAAPTLSYASAVSIAAPAVVNIHTTRLVRTRANPLVDDEFLRRFFNRGANNADRTDSDLGSGVLIGPNGIVVTNHHVVAMADEIRVALRDGRSAKATIVGADPDTDLAVLKIELNALPTIEAADVGTLSVGDVVLAIGNPFGVGQTVTMGIVSAKSRSRLGINTFEDFIQTDAAINPGNSGGALITPAGRLVGINTAIVSQSGGSEGIGFAIPVHVVHHVVREILEHGRVRRGWLGIEINALTARQARENDVAVQSGAVVVLGVMAGGPGERAGLMPSDLITQINGKPVVDPQGAVNLISAVPPGGSVKITILRDGASQLLDAVVSQRPG